MIRKYNIKELIEQDIESTEENLNRYQEEKTRLANKMIKNTEKKKKLESVPIYYYVGHKRAERVKKRTPKNVRDI
ncbi:hypothetical protein KQI38_09700 [Tissierella carlieri]|uniref:hypothetical protein n=1 Tax=Tissierella carlieri TaxID=689904 RepID=UPI001C1058FD|nr:hypothetical protein [Tissierella carlieri]MBU5312302.1 hypothetical protein [Tissierella carlieri]